MTKWRIALVLGSVRPNRFGIRPARWLLEKLNHHPQLDVSLLDLAEHPLPFFAEEMSPMRAPRKYRTPEIAKLGKLIDEADGFIWASPEYNHGYSSVIKNAIDHYSVEWKRKPVAFLGYGNAGGSRAIQQLRQVAVEMELAPLRHAVHVPPESFLKYIKDPGVSDAELFEPVAPRAQLLADDLAWWAKALGEARAEEKATAASP